MSMASVAVVVALATAAKRGQTKDIAAFEEAEMVTNSYWMDIQVSWAHLAAIEIVPEGYPV